METHWQISALSPRAELLKSIGLSSFFAIQSKSIDENMNDDNDDCKFTESDVKEEVNGKIVNEQ